MMQTISIQIGAAEKRWDDIIPTYHRVEEGTAPTIAQNIADATRKQIRMTYIPAELKEIPAIFHEYVGRLSGHYFRPKY